jgi:hypothetical protein
MKKNILSLTGIFLVVFLLLFLNQNYEKKLCSAFLKDSESTDNTLREDINVTKKLSSNNFTVNYNESFSDGFAESILNQFEDIRMSYIDLGFECPKKGLYVQLYDIYLDVSTKNDGKPYGKTVQFKDIQTNSIKSYIILHIKTYETKEGGKDKHILETIGHEFFHAIQFQYNLKVDWFTEACACFMSKYVTGEHSISDAIYKENFEDLSKSIFDSKGYAFKFIPEIVVKNHGGIKSLLSIYNLLKTLNNRYSENEFLWAFNIGLRNNHQDNVYFDDVYIEMMEIVVNPMSLDYAYMIGVDVRDNIRYELEKGKNIHEAYTLPRYSCVIKKIYLNNFTHWINLSITKNEKLVTKVSNRISEYNDPSSINYNVRDSQAEYLLIICANSSIFNGNETLEYEVKLKNHISQNHHCTLCGIYTSQHDYINYIWKDKMTHYSECVCGEKVVQCHCVSSSGDKSRCLLCHGAVERGIVGPFSDAKELNGQIDFTNIEQLLIRQIEYLKKYESNYILQEEGDDLK